MVKLRKGPLVLEGEYTTWTFVWSRDYGAGVTLDEVKVDNSGTVYAENYGPPNVYVKTAGGVETNVADYTFHLLGTDAGFSATGKYVIGSPSDIWRELEVWKDGVNIFSRDVQLDEPNIVVIERTAISPNGKFAALLSYSSVTSVRSIVLLYEGS